MDDLWEKQLKRSQIAAMVANWLRTLGCGEGERIGHLITVDARRKAIPVDEWELAQFAAIIQVSASWLPQRPPTRYAAKERFPLRREEFSECAKMALIDACSKSQVDWHGIAKASRA